MRVHRSALAAALVSLLFPMAAQAATEQFPSKPLRLVTSGFGGGNDVAARIVARGLTDVLKQQVIVENRGSVVPGEIVMHAPPDGYTLLLGTNSLWTGALLRKTSPYDPIKDFAPIAMALDFPTIMAVNGALPVKTLKEFIAHAKTKPGELNYVMTSTGGSAHLASELLNTLTGIRMTGIPYKNAGVGIADLISGRTHVFFSAAGPVMPHVQTGKLKALGVTSAKPSALFPELPTVASTVPGYEMVATYCIFAPARTPASVINLLNREIVKVLKSPETKALADKAGMEVVASTPQELDAMRKADIARVRKLIKDAGLPIEN